ncbi:MAG: N-6 DNA methylase [Mycobacterium sp.]|nr:N-6 DNA methylase [Mycobacterium sp.]
MAAPRRRAQTANVSDLHRQWLQLVDTDGPFLAIAPLKRVWPQGMPSLPEDRKDTLVDARKDFEPAWETLDRHPDDEATLDGYRVARDKWVETVLRDVVGWAESLSWGEVPGVSAQSPNRAVTVTAQAALTGPDGIGALVCVIDPVDSLRQVPNDLWAATPIDRMEALLRDNGIQIGIVTDGRWWGLVCAREGAMAASGIVDALTWVEEPRTRDAFFTIIARQYLIGGDPSDRLPELFKESVAAAEEITEALGSQVRRAVELLIASFSEAAADAQRRGLPNPMPAHPHDAYEAAVTTMMRIVFLLFAEERGLLPTGELFEHGYGISGSLDRLQGRETHEGEEALDATSMVWHRLLATSQALYAGASFEGMRMPAYGGSLFDPSRFGFLTATTEQGTLALTVSDRVMLHALRSVQQADLKGGEARRISFRDIDVEQIGYIYEGLLGYTAITVTETYVGLNGTKGEEPEIPLVELEKLDTANDSPKKLAAAIRSWVEQDQPSAKPQSESAITKGVGAAVEPNVVSALTQAVGDDAELRERVLPWLGLIRQDLRGRPMVVRAGGLMVKETPSRKNAGAHYTPKSLAEEVVLYALQPLCYQPGPYQTADESTWTLKPSDDILSLKVADIACGSGAFLVAAARYLAERVVEAWTVEDPANSQRGDLYLRAVREVVANCIYGADINDMAVEMCKLSLWLVSLDRDLPFSFVDDKVLLGNSLLGLTSLDQLRKLHIDPSRVPVTTMIDFYDVDIDAIIHKAAELRRKLASVIDENDPARNSAAKRRQLAQLHAVTAQLRKIADSIVATGLPLGGKPGKALDEAYENLRIAVKAAHPETGEPDSTMLDTIIDKGLTPTVDSDYKRWLPNHWVMEVPDVVLEIGGFDAIIGNPPFLVGKKISGAIGIEHREYLVNQIADGVTGNADLVAFFLQRAAALLRPEGVLGLVTAKVIAEGDTRQVGLDQLLVKGFVIQRAARSRLWPSKSAATRYSIIWGSFAKSIGEGVLDGRTVGSITSSLEPGGRVSGLPVRLAANMGKSFKGYDLGGDGFQLSADEAQVMLSADTKNSDVLFRYLNGKDLNSSVTLEGSGWAISFGERSIDEARSYTAPFERIEKMVLPVRLLSNRKSHRDRWWVYAESRPALTHELTHTDRVIALSASSRHAAFAIIPVGAIFSSAIVLIPDATFGRLATLSSSIHLNWILRWGSMLKLDIRYSTSDVFDTFPFPNDLRSLDAIGARFDSERGDIMSRRDLGLTKLYNLVNDSQIADASDADIARMRAIYVELDDAVMDAYGWSDIRLDHGFHTYRQIQRWTVSPAARVEILDRLLEENHRRAADEAKATTRPEAKGRRGRNVSDEQETLPL